MKRGYHSRRLAVSTGGSLLGCRDASIRSSIEIEVCFYSTVCVEVSINDATVAIILDALVDHVPSVVLIQPVVGKELLPPADLIIVLF